MPRGELKGYLARTDQGKRAIAAQASFGSRYPFERTGGYQAPVLIEDAEHVLDVVRDKWRDRQRAEPPSGVVLLSNLSDSYWDAITALQQAGLLVHDEGMFYHPGRELAARLRQD